MPARAARPARSTRWLIGALALCAGAALVCGGEDEPALSPAVKAASEAPYLTPAEARGVRVFHGLATSEDLLDVPSRARSALLWGAYADRSLDDPAADVLDRAEARVRRGEPESALELVGAAADPRASRLRAQGLEMLGREREAIEAARGVVDRLVGGEIVDAPGVVEAVRCANILARLRGSAPDGQDHQSMMRLLGAAREKMDRLYWPAALVEAELLLEKDNYEQAHQALEQVLSLCPSCASAQAMLGRLAVGAFDIPAASAIADRLEEIAVVPEPDARGDQVPGKAVSVEGAIVRARALLRTDAPELASAELDKALVVYPRSRELLQTRAGVVAAGYDPAALARELDAYDALSPGERKPAGAYYWAGKTLSDLRQYAQGAKLLEEAQRRAPRWPAPAIELGLLQVQAGQDERARVALEAAAALDPFNVRAGNSLKLLKDLSSFSKVQSEHFVVRARPGVDLLLAQEMLPALEENFRMVTGPDGVDHAPAGRTLIELMPDHAFFAVRIAGMPRIHTIAASTGPVIAMESPREGKNHTGTYDWQRVLRHEYTHTAGLSRTGNRLPHWFTEAQAVYLERAPRDYPTCQLLASALERGTLFDFVKINIAFTRPEKPTDRQQAYAQGHWMYEFMVERFGPRAPLELMDLYAQGVREEEAFARVLRLSRSAFFERFTVWASEQLVGWGMVPRTGVPTLAALIARDALTGEPDESAMTRWLTEYPDHPEVLEALIELRLAAVGAGAPDHPDPALRPLLERYARARPVDPMPHRHLARLALASEDPREHARAIEHLEYLDAREDHAPTYAAELARLYAQFGDLERASAKSERATRVGPYVAAHRELAATIALLRGDRATARRHLEFLVALEPDRPIHAQRLEALERLGTSHGP